MIRFLVTLDLWVRKIFAAFCMIALFLMVVFTIYTVRANAMKTSQMLLSTVSKSPHTGGSSNT